MTLGFGTRKDDRDAIRAARVPVHGGPDMSYAVWKFPLTFATVQDIEMPQGAEVLSVGLQGDEPQRIVVWARCHTAAVKMPRRFYVVTTGDDALRESCIYRGTVQIHDPGWPELVLHVFEGG